MATQQPMKKGAAYETVLPLTSQADTDIFQVNPTIATGDAKVSIDGGALTNLTTTPTVVGTSQMVKINLSASETNGDYIFVLLHDASGDEWCDLALCWHTVTNQFDDLSTASAVTTVDTVVDGIKAVTDNLPDSGALSSLATASALATAQTDLDTLTGSDGATLATSQPNYAPATSAALATVDGNVDAIKAKTDNLPAAPAAVGDIPTAATVADAVWDEAKSGHVSAGTFGEEVQAHALSTEVDALPTAAENRVEMDSNSTQLAAIVADTAELQADWANGGRLDLLIDAILEDTGTTIPALIAALNDLSAAEVNAQVVDALSVDTYAEPGSVPAATATLAAKLGWLFFLARNRITQTATTQTAYADDGSTSVATAGVSDDGTTFTKNEWS